MIIAATVKSMVCGSTAPTSARIGRLVTIELPKSPRSDWPRNTTYCSQIGLSKPSLACNAATACGVARSPRIATAGSPGTMRTSTNTSVSTASRVGIAASRRRRM